MINVSYQNEHSKKEELQIFKSEDNENNLFKQIHFIKSIDGGKIKSLSELRNGNLLLVQNKYFKIIRVSRMKKELNIIQNQGNDIENYNQIIELINGNLVSISYIPNTANNIISWEKDLINDLYGKEASEHPLTIPLSLFELNKHSFLVYFHDGLISMYNSKTMKEIEKLKKINCEIIAFTKINDDNILLLCKKNIIIFNILLNEISKAYSFNYNCINICKLNDSNNIYLNDYNYENSYGLILLIHDLFIQKIESSEIIINNIHSDRITCFKLLKNNNLVTGSVDKYIKFWKIFFIRD